MSQGTDLGVLLGNGQHLYQSRQSPECKAFEVCLRVI